MARRPRVLIEGGIYHVTCRGNERRAIFLDDRDRLRLLQNLADSAEAFGVRIYLYCLMTNHVHLLVETPLGNLDRFMGSLLTGYTVYFNRRHKRVGHLMQGRYGAQVVEGNEYLLKLSRYVHLNPVRVRSIKALDLKERLQYLRRYRWSSYAEYTGKKRSTDWLQKEPVWAMMEGVAKNSQPHAYARYVEAGLARSDEEFEVLVNTGGVAIGTDEFVESIKRMHLQRVGSGVKREDVSFRAIRNRRSVEEIETAVRKVVGKGWETFKDFHKGRKVRGIMAWALRTYGGLTQREIAEHIGLKTGSAVSHLLTATRISSCAAEWQKALHSTFKGFSERRRQQR
ncbi:MAG: transposase [Kiritimatiellae bacterium]|nr:transposase [Kiritimatiellia bacterium]